MPAAGDVTTARARGAADMGSATADRRHATAKTWSAANPRWCGMRSATAHARTTAETWATAPTDPGTTSGRRARARRLRTRGGRAGRRRRRSCTRRRWGDTRGSRRRRAAARAGMRPLRGGLCHGKRREGGQDEGQHCPCPDTVPDHHIALRSAAHNIPRRMKETTHHARAGSLTHPLFATLQIIATGRRE
jgi:hypothetical protein